VPVVNLVMNLAVEMAVAVAVASPEAMKKRLEVGGENSASVEEMELDQTDRKSRCFGENRIGNEREEPQK
jgi:hypothetical protein